MFGNWRLRQKFLRLMLPALLAVGSVFAIWMPTAATAGTLSATGNACLFNAPNGVINGGLVGHVGWAFQNGTADSWTFGAAEQAGRLWMKTGSWANVLATFGQGSSPYPTGPDYYRSFRCEAVSSTSTTSAYNTAYTQTHNGYSIPSNDCLTKAILILQSYGATNLPSSSALNLSALPNTYYLNHLPASFNWPPSSLTTATIGVLLKDPLNGSYIKTNPLHKTRPLTLQVYNASNALIYQDTVNAVVIPGTDRYVATVPLDWQRDWSPGGNATVVLVKVKLDYTLLKQVTGFYLIKAGIDTALPDTSVKVGDVNQDNSVNITDYNLMMQCYSDLQPPKGPCSAALKRAADLNDDGYVNGIDYNLMLRVLQNQGGS
jgi:hypothetical protein